MRLVYGLGTGLSPTRYCRGCLHPPHSVLALLDGTFGGTQQYSEQQEVIVQIPLLPEQLSIILALISFLLIGVTSMVGSNRPSSVLVIVILLLVATITLAAGLAMRWDRLGQGPFMTLFEVLHSNLFSLTFVYMFIYWRVEKTRPALPVVMGFLLLLSVWALNAGTEPRVLPPTFDHPWLWIHVISGKIFLVFCMAGTSLAILLLGQKLFSGINGRLQAASYDPVVWRLMAVAFIFHSFMLVAGAVWAHDAWGRYWSWDPLETWSLLTWLSLAVVLHMRITFQSPAWLGWLLVIGVFILAFLTFFGVPFFSIAPHKGVM